MFELPSGWTQRTVPSLRQRLLAWFDRHQRDLPWRSNRDPYAIWVSEVMLQQTTVAAVIPYFHRFLAALPTVRSLAEADEQVVLKLWEGLGYYRRARHLHAAARQLVAVFGDDLPDDPEVWAELPGVGRYILGAVLSQAFDRQLPIVEANSLRVLARLFGSRLNPRVGLGKTWVWAAAERMVPPVRAGDYNQALMELGARVCTPVNPGCTACPLARDCVAAATGLQDVIPPQPVRVQVTEVSEVAVIVRDRDSILLCLRPPTAGRWQNMWEIPHAMPNPGENTDASAVRLVRQLTGLEIEPRERLTTIRHRVTRYAITLTCLEAVVVGGRFRSEFYTDHNWVPLAELASYPVSAPQRKLLSGLAKPRERHLFSTEAEG